MRDYNRRGWTMVEILIVIGLMGLLLSIALPAYQGIGRGSRMTAALNNLASTIQLARQWAITKRENVYLIIPARDNMASMQGKYWRSYTLYSENNGQIMEWRYLPDGIFFDRDASWSSGWSVINGAPQILQNEIDADWNTVSGRLHLDVGERGYVLKFTPYGTAGGNNAKVFYLSEAIIDTSGNVSPKNDNLSAAVYFYSGTGQTQIRRNND